MNNKLEKKIDLNASANSSNKKDYYITIYILGRGKPGWGKESTRPPWWPKDVPWANVRMDARSEDQKQKVRLCFICILHC